MIQVSVREMMEAGAHFGHQTHRWDPRMKPYIYGARNGVHIIDLQKTTTLWEQACEYVTRVVARGGHVLFVGTKRQAQEIVAEEAARCKMFSVSHRWLGGTLTNFPTIQSSINRLKDLEKKRDEENLAGFTKKEKLMIEREIDKLLKSFGGIKNMPGVPSVVFVIDPHKEDIALKEANRLKIPVVAIADTNCNPNGIDYLIPANDDAIKSIRLFASRMADAVLQGLVERESVIREKVSEDAANKGAAVREAAGTKANAFVANAESFEEAVDGKFQATPAS